MLGLGSLDSQISAAPAPAGNAGAEMSVLIANAELVLAPSINRERDGIPATHQIGTGVAGAFAMDCNEHLSFTWLIVHQHGTSAVHMVDMCGCSCNCAGEGRGPAAPGRNNSIIGPQWLRQVAVAGPSCKPSDRSLERNSAWRRT